MTQGSWVRYASRPVHTYWSSGSLDRNPSSVSRSEEWTEEGSVGACVVHVGVSSRQRLGGGGKSEGGEEALTHHDARDAVDAEHDAVLQRVVRRSLPRRPERSADGAGGDNHLLFAYVEC